MTSLLIHIGDAKTGTSSIQRQLTHDRNALLEIGVLYPKTGLLAAHGIAQHHLSFSLLDKYPKWANPNEKKEPDSIFGELFDEIKASDCDTIVVSSEAFCSLREKPKILELLELTKNYEVKILCYLRRPDHWLESWYSQIVKGFPFTKLTFNEYLNDHQPLRLGAIHKYADVFGDENIIVRPFERKNFVSENLIQDFYSHLGVNLEFQEQEAINVTPTVEIIELIRRLNSIIDLSILERDRLNKKIVKALGPFGSKNKKYFTDRERQNFIDKNQLEISSFEERFKGQIGEEFFHFSEPEESINLKQETHELSLSFDSVEALMIEMIKEKL